MMTTLRLGMIGCGNLGRVHVQCVSSIPAAAFAAYADIDPSAAERLLQEFGGSYATDDTQRLLDDASIDAVYICTRHDSHAALAIAAAEAGKHIFIEKPLALSLADCEAVARAVQRHHVYLMPAFKARFYPLVQRAKAFIPVPQVIVGQMMDRRWPDGWWSQDPLQGGANVQSQGCHTVDLLRYFAGCEAQTLWAVGGAVTHPGHSCLDQCAATIRFENGTIANWTQGDAGLAAFTSKFYFSLHAGGRSVQLHARMTKATFDDGERTWTEERPEEEGYQLENEAFIAALVADTPPTPHIFDAVQVTRIVLAAERAVRTGAVQVLNTEAPSLRPLPLAKATAPVV